MLNKILTLSLLVLFCTPTFAGEKNSENKKNEQVIITNKNSDDKALDAAANAVDLDPIKVCQKKCRDERKVCISTLTCDNDAKTCRSACGSDDKECRKACSATRAECVEASECPQKAKECRKDCKTAI